MDLLEQIKPTVWSSLIAPRQPAECSSVSGNGLFE